MHALLQLPQFWASFSSETSHPVSSEPSQLPKPELHTMAQAPALQLANPFTLLHACPHEPQCCVDVLRFVSQPLSAAPSQLPQPVSHVPTRHVPVVHEPVA